MTSRKQVTKYFDLTGYGNLVVTILSDTHGELHPEISRLSENSDVVLHAGDIMGNHVLRSLRPRLGLVIAVRGNNDLPMTWIAREHHTLREIPDVAVVQFSSGKVSMEHGHLIDSIDLDHSNLGYKHSDSRMVIYGHTHIQIVDDQSLPWLVNPGAAGASRNKGGASCYQLYIEGEKWLLEPFKFRNFRKAG